MKRALLGVLFLLGVSSKKVQEIGLRGDKTIVVTGAAGFIGSHATLSLLEEGFSVVGIDDLSRGWMENVHALQQVANTSEANFQFIEADLGKEGVLKDVLEDARPAAVLHFAGVAYAAESIKKPLKYFENNTVNTLRLVEAMQATGVGNLVFSSSCATYGSPREVPITEETEQVPVSPYGRSKLQAEQLLKHWVNAEIVDASKPLARVALLRYFNVIGADPQARLGERRPKFLNSQYKRLSTAMLDSAQGLIPAFQIFGSDYDTIDGTAVRDYIHVSDLASAHVVILQKMLSASVRASAQDNLPNVLYYNLGTGQPFSVKQMVAACKQVTGSDFKVVRSKSRAGDPPQVWASARKMREDMGWEAKFTNITETFEHMWKFRLKEAFVGLSQSGKKVAEAFFVDESGKEVAECFVEDESGLPSGSFRKEGVPWDVDSALGEVTRAFAFGVRAIGLSSSGREDRLPLVWAACGVQYCEQFLVSYKTAVGQIILDKFHKKSVTHDLYLVADESCKQILNQRQSEISHPAVKLNILDLSQITSIDGSNVQLFKYCSPVRLYVAQLFESVTQIDRFLYVDSDSVIVDSLASTAQLLEDASNVPLFLSNEVTTPCPGSWYADKPNIRYGDCGLNAGILGVNMQAWKAKHIDTRVLDAIKDYKDGLISLPLGDQDVLNYIGKKDPSLIFEAPCNMNMRTDSGCPAEQSPIILHGNRGVLNNKWSGAKAKLLTAAEDLMRDGATSGDPPSLSQKAGLVQNDWRN